MFVVLINEKILQMPKFIINTDDLNSYGYRILTSGIQTTFFEGNPIALFNHRRSHYGGVNALPIGNWENLKRGSKQMSAELRVDEVTDMDKAVKAKIESGTLRATSIGIRILEWSEDSAFLVKGQTRPTVTKCELMEVSVVDIPANGYCIKLSYGDKTVTLTGAEDDIEALDSILPIIKNHNMKLVSKHLQLGDGASEADIIAHISTLQNQKTQLANEVKELQQKLKDVEEHSAKSKADSLVQSAIEQKKITESQRGTWESLALNDYDSAKAALGSMKGFTSLSSQVNEPNGNTADLDDKAKYDAKWKEGKLSYWKEQNPEEFERCQKAYFG